MRKFILSLLAMAVVGGVFAGETEKLIEFPKPNMEREMTLMEALSQRQTDRSFSEKELSMQDLGDLLWAANGVNRPESGKRTAPSAKNRQDIKIYVVDAKGVYLYLAKEHALKPITSDNADHRQDVRGKKGAVDLVLVADKQEMYAETNAGYISQNIYLFCVANDMATVACGGSLDRDKYKEVCKLNPEQVIILKHPVGYK